MLIAAFGPPLFLYVSLCNVLIGIDFGCVCLLWFWESEEGREGELVSLLPVLSVVAEQPAGVEPTLHVLFLSFFSDQSLINYLFTL